MTGLHAALTAICDRNVRTLAPHPGMRLDVSVMELRRLLAAHPAELAPVANPERVAEGLRLHLLATGPSDWDAADVKVCAESFTDALTAAGVFRDEATVKAELAELIAVRSQELIGGGPGGIAAAIAREAVTK